MVSRTPEWHAAYDHIKIPYTKRPTNVPIAYAYGRSGFKTGAANPNYTHGLSGTRQFYFLQYRKRRRAMMASGRVTRAEKRERIAEYDGKCVYCGAPYQAMDHYTPLVRGGKHVIDNLYPACKHCNSKKRSKLAGLEWFPEIERMLDMGREW